MPGLDAAFWAYELAIALLILIIIVSYFSAAPPVFSGRRTAENMIDLAGIKAGMRVIDLGSGDGRLLRLAAAKGAYAVGYEINPLLVLYSRLKAFRSPYSRQISVRWGNLWSADLSGADAVFVYLMPWKMEKLKEELLPQLRPGALIVSNTFVFRDWEPCRVDEKNRVYVFRVGDRSLGPAASERKFKLEVDKKTGKV